MYCVSKVDLLAVVKMKCYATELPDVPIEISSVPLRRCMSRTDKEITRREVSASPGRASSFRCVVPVSISGGTARRHYNQKAS